MHPSQPIESAKAVMEFIGRLTYNEFAQIKRSEKIKRVSVAAEAKPQSGV
jgi:hypothetical protein